MLRAFKGKYPKIDESCFISDNAVITGDVNIGENSTIWDCSVIRADVDKITVGKNSNIQDGSVLHVDYNTALEIGDGVTIGHGVMLHGCKIGNNSLIGIGAILLNGVEIGENCIIGAGALLTPGTKISDGSLVLGSPGKVIRSVREEEVLKNNENAKVYVQLGKDYLIGEL